MNLYGCTVTSGTKIITPGTKHRLFSKYRRWQGHCHNCGCQFTCDGSSVVCRWTDVNEFPHFHLPKCPQDGCPFQPGVHPIDETRVK